MPIFEIVIVAFFIVAFLAIGVWATFFNKPKASGFIQEDSIDDKKELFSVLNHNDDGGEPLVAYAPVSNKKLDNDPWF